jgi:hypothetical protein
MYKCPKCGKPLTRVRQREPKMLNDEQFDSMKAGDYVCEAGCKGNRGISGLLYFWEHELANKSLELDRQKDACHSAESLVFWRSK